MYKINIKELVQKAKEVSQNAYSPYSKFQVGAALFTEDGKVYTGCNIENGGIQSICAERVAFAKALSEGTKKFVAIAVVGKYDAENEFIKTVPCGICRQFINEFCSKDFKIYVTDNRTDEIIEYTIEDLLPEAFRL